jgi:hypothetical protein
VVLAREVAAAHGRVIDHRWCKHLTIAVLPRIHRHTPVWRKEDAQTTAQGTKKKRNKTRENGVPSGTVRDKGAKKKKRKRKRKR